MKKVLLLVTIFSARLIAAAGAPVFGGHVGDMNKFQRIDVLCPGEQAGCVSQYLYANMPTGSVALENIGLAEDFSTLYPRLTPVYALYLGSIFDPEGSPYESSTYAPDSPYTKAHEYLFRMADDRVEAAFAVGPDAVHVWVNPELKRNRALFN